MRFWQRGFEQDLPETTRFGGDSVALELLAYGEGNLKQFWLRAKPYAATEIRNSSGEVIYRRSDEAPRQVLSSQVVGDMNFMLNKVVEAGTGGRAQLEGRKVAGKTGTTSAYRDAWFVGYTGNLVGAVWLGNDDHSSTNKMTGGTLPAQIWHEIMAPAHQGLDIKPLPGLNDSKAPPPRIAQAPAADANAPSSVGKLSRRSFEVMSNLNGFFRTIEPRPATAGPETGTERKAGSIKPDPARSGALRPVGTAVDVAEGGRFEQP